MTSRLGTRGGRTATFDQGAALIESHKASQAEEVRRQIATVALENGEVHGDDIDVELAEANVVGATFNALARRGLLRPLDWRKSQKPASHGRQSRVWALTEQGERAARKLVGVASDSTTRGAGTRAGTAVAGDSGAAPSAGSEPPFLPGPVEEPPDYEVSTRRLKPHPTAGLVWSWIEGEPPAYWRWLRA